MILDRPLGFLSRDVAMDLGTANTLIYLKGQGIILNEPSVVAINSQTGKIMAVGKEAKEYIGRTPKRITSIRPLKDGVIADFDITQGMIRYFLRRVCKRGRFIRPRIVIGVPTGITQVEKKAVIDAALQSGVRSVYLIEEPMAAAIGAKLSVNGAHGNMVVDIGGGTSEVAVISLSAIAYSESIRVAGDEANEAIVRYFQKTHQLLIGENAAEDAKLEIGSALSLETPLRSRIAGKDLITSDPKSLEITDRELRKAMEEPIQAIVDAVNRALAKTPPELVVDIKERGIYLAGGGALLRGLDKLIALKTNLDVHMPNDPLLTVVQGCGRVMENIKEWRQVFIN